MNSNLSVQIGRRVRATREYLELSRDKFVEKADISVQFLAEIEAGKKNMSTTTLYKVAKALNVSADYLVFGTEHNGDVSILNNILSQLSPENLKYAEELLKTFVKSLPK